MVLCIRYKASLLMMVPIEVLENIVPIVLSKLYIFSQILGRSVVIVMCLQKERQFPGLPPVAR